MSDITKDAQEPSDISSDITKQVALRMPPELIARMDERRKLTKMSRNEWITTMVEFTLDHMPYDPDASKHSHSNAKIKIMKDGP